MGVCVWVCEVCENLVSFLSPRGCAVSESERKNESAFLRQIMADQAVNEFYTLLPLLQRGNTIFSR